MQSKCSHDAVERQSRKITAVYPRLPCDCCYDCLMTAVRLPFDYFALVASRIMSRAMTFRWIWFAPSKIWRIFASRIIFSAGYSFM